MSKKFRFHILGVPHTSTNAEYTACAYTAKARKFGKMMKARGHHIIHYGHEESNLICDEHVTVTTNKDLEIAYGNYDWRKNFFKFDVRDHAYQTFYKNAILEIEKRKQPLDFILPFWGQGVKPICDAHPDLICVEPGIGYADGHWAQWKIFESYAIYHAYCGLRNVGECRQSWYDVVIPNYFDLDEFEYSDKKQDYFLYLGRVYDGKGVNIAIQVTEKIGAKLIIAGQKDDSYQLPSHCEYVGYADVNKRKELMKNAKGSFLPSMYVEPFGGVQIENLLCGTPTITTDWGAFAENNIEGVTGYRCRTFEDFVNAALNIDKINPADCRKQGEKFSLENIALKYEKYFNDVMNVYTGNGWYQISENCDLEQIDKEEKPFAENLAAWIKQHAIPDAKIIDLGCGLGTYVKALRDQGFNAIGYDIDPKVKGKPNLIHADLFSVNDLGNIVMCLEVAEHIHEKLSDNVVKAVCKNVAGGGVVIWTAAKPGQGGTGHINCQPKEYWQEKFKKEGFYRNYDIENSIINYVTQGYYMGWFVNNLMVLQR